MDEEEATGRDFEYCTSKMSVVEDDVINQTPANAKETNGSISKLQVRHHSPLQCEQILTIYW